MSKSDKGTSRAPSAALIPRNCWEGEFLYLVGHDLAGYFVDPETGERLADDEKEDVHGTLLIGEDDDEPWGLWWGTERAAWVLSPYPMLVYVSGYLGATHWHGLFIGTEAQAITYAKDRRVRDIETECDPLSDDFASRVIDP